VLKQLAMGILCFYHSAGVGRCGKGDSGLVLI